MILYIELKVAIAFFFCCPILHLIDLLHYETNINSGIQYRSFFLRSDAFICTFVFNDGKQSAENDSRCVSWNLGHTSCVHGLMGENQCLKC